MLEFAFSAAARGVEAVSAVFSNALVWTQQSEKFEIGVQSLIWWPSLYLEMAEICVYIEIKTIPFPNLYRDETAQNLME